ncbi:MAG TPA: Clp protease N-terminal domain-containing protein [Mycobacteriales bacterium]|nr:Clp protease N-terminal domain-containing protein [Mycobacteriales bacterium]
MMFERFTDEARAAIVAAQIHARRLGHHYIGCEHLLLAVAASEGETGRILRAAGLAPTAVEAETLRLLGTPGGTLDRAALAAIGIDLDVVREKIEASFGPQALAPRARHTRRHRWSRRRECGPVTGHIPFTARAKKCLELAVGEATALHQQHIGAEHLALAFTAMTSGLAPEILSSLGVAPARLRAEILDRYRQAG